MTVHGNSDQLPDHDLNCGLIELGLLLGCVDVTVVIGVPTIKNWDMLQFYSILIKESIKST